MSDAETVALTNVHRSFGAQLVIDNLSFVVPAGSLFGLIGPNGSGKTTTMRMILRIYQPDSGEVRVLGQPAGRTADHRLGYLPEERGLYPRMTVRRILRYFARLKQVRNADDAIDRWLDALGMTGWSNKRVDQLSKGMAQKVQFITAVISEPKLAILDEPFSGLDPVNLDLLREAVRDLRRNGTTVILSTHDMDVAQAMCDRVLMIYRGRNVLEGTLDDIRLNKGQPRLRVRMAAGRPLPSDLPGVETVLSHGTDYDLLLSDLTARPAVLSTLAAAGDLEHFETVRPSLHDIFVSIAGPEAASNPSPATTLETVH
ncbi:ABC transporter ATP-binding protein [Planctomycetaceae bacterium SH139]